MSWLNMFGNGGKRGVRSNRACSMRRRRMSLESLESRQLLSVNPIANMDVYSTETSGPGFEVMPEYGLLSNDTPQNMGDTLLVNEALSSDSTSNGGTVIIGDQGEFGYYPAPGFVGYDTFTYVVEEYSANGILQGSSKGTAVISVGLSSTDPIAVTDVYSWTQDTKSHVDADDGVLANDQSPTGGRIWVSPEYPLAGEIKTDHGTVTFDVDPTSTDKFGTGGFWYEPDDGFVGVDTFRYTATDMYNSTVSNDGIVAIVVNGTEATINPDYYTATENGGPLSVSEEFGLLANDRITSGETLTVAAVVNKTTVNGGTYSIEGTGTFRYEPAAGFSGTDTFAYEIYTQSGAYVGLGQAIITVVKADLVIPPRANTDVYTMSTVEMA